jgi:hypothetical protein
MLRRLLARWGGRRIVGVDQLTAFLDRQSAQISHRSIVGYVHVKTRLPLHELMKERPFAEAFEVARWEAYAAILSDLVVFLHDILRPAAEDRESLLIESLQQLYRQILERHPVPGHRSAGWTDAIDEFSLRLAQASLAPPRGIARIAEHSAERLYATLPIHERLRAPDKPAIVANVQFLMVGLAHEFRRLDAGALVAELVSGRGAAA